MRYLAFSVVVDSGAASEWFTVQETPVLLCAALSWPIASQRGGQ